MALPAEKRMTLAEYLALEERSEVKHELYDGHMLAMAGGTIEHALLAAKANQMLANALGARPCAVFTSDLRVCVSATGLRTYPDLSIVCGPIQREPEDPNSVTNPVALFEVLSPSTEAYDRGEKFEHYRQIPTLRDYVLVCTGRDRVEHYSRNDDGSWTVRHCGPGDSVSLSGVEATLSVGALYQNVAIARTPPSSAAS